eukprot:TRINITY_DN4587_c0_g1_i1.p1 TRINITY_DN4587_c0_g1~~TRINITY_DN4587_c0_g1_i1.p1  ORF type:complete len:110 (+),score=15.08 TRINITY_DN4587_c0_g1_i1:103-432(+)
MAEANGIPLPDKSSDTYVEQIISLCRISEMTDRYEDMCKYLKVLLTAKKGDLSEDERNLFSVGFKSVISGLRRSWRNVSQETDGDKKLREDYKGFIQSKIDAVCDDVIS